MSTTYDAITQILNARQVLIADDQLGKSIVQENGKLQVRGPGEDLVIELPAERLDLATAYYDAIDGRARAWAAPFLPRGINANEKGDKEFRVYAAGATPRDCILGLLDSINDLPGVQQQASVMSDYHEEQGQWSAYVAGEANGYKVAGVLVPGGAILTSWI
jgi:hypothetical protein